MERFTKISRDELSWIRQKVRMQESVSDSKQQYLDELSNQIIDLRQQSIQIATYDDGRHNEDEIYRLRQILDVLNKRIEELRIIVSKEDEHSAVGAKILKDKDEFIIELKRQLNSLPSEESMTEGSSTKSKKPRRNKGLDKGKKSLKSANSESRFIDRPNYTLTAVRKKIKRNIEQQSARVSEEANSNSKFEDSVDSMIADYIRENQIDYPIRKISKNRYMFGTENKYVTIQDGKLIIDNE